MTKNGVVYNLKDSPYITRMYGIAFYFSSKPHQVKFENGVKNHINTISDSLSNRFGFDVKVYELPAVHYYAKIETRGFLIMYDGRVFECLESLKLNGERLIKKDCPAV